MTDAARRPGCLDSEELAAFIDGRVDAAARASAEAHLAECEDCYEAMVETARLGTTLEERGAHSAGSPRRRFWVVLGSSGVLAAAAALLLAFVQPHWLHFGARSDDAMDQLIRAVGPHRFADARLAEQFDWGPRPTIVRGAASEKPAAHVLAAAVALEESLERSRTADTLHNAGVAHLAVGEIAEAIGDLENAASLTPNQANVHIDLAAALLERWRQEQAPTDALKAFDEVEQAKSHSGDHVSPALLFDRALAYEATGALEDAAAAWQGYLKVDSTSSWGIEAKERLASLRARAKSADADISNATTPAELSQIANTRAFVLYRYLDRAVLLPWAEHTISGEPFSIDSARPIADALRHAGRDVYQADLVDAAATVGTAGARTCLAHAILDMRDARQQFELSSYKASETKANAAATQFACGGTTTLDARIQQLWARFFEDQRDQVVRELAPLNQEVHARPYLRMAGRAAYMRGSGEMGNGRFDAGMAAYQDALAAYERAQDVDQEAATHVLMAEAAAQEGDADATWSHLAEALSRLELLSSPRLRYFVLSNAELQALLSGHVAAALSFSHDLQATAKAWGAAVGYVDEASLSVRLFTTLGRPEDAERAVSETRQALSQFEPEVQAQYAADVGLAEAQALQTSKPDIALSDLKPALERIAKADLSLNDAEVMLVQGRAYRAQGNITAAQESWLRGVSALEDQNPTIRDQQLRVSRTDGKWELFSELIRTHDQEPVASLAIAERARGRALLDSLGHNQVIPTLTAEHLSDWFPDGASALVYSVLPDELLVWHVTRHGVQLQRQPIKADDLAARVDRFVQRVRSGATGGTDDLAPVLLPASFTDERSDVVAILPDGPLWQVPFGALRIRGTDRFLAQDAIVTIEPSLTIMKRIARAKPRAGTSALLIGYGESQPSLGLPALRNVSNEIVHLKNLYGIQANALVGSSATAAAISKAVTSATIVHIAGHAVADDVHPARSHLFVAPDAADSGALGPQAIAGLHLSPGTSVVLSACEGARGHVAHGEGPMNLARSFLAAGASSVVANLWPVSDDGADAFVVELHKRMIAGTSLDRALADTQRTLLLHAPTAAWAGWIVIGAAHN